MLGDIPPASQQADKLIAILIAHKIEPETVVFNPENDDPVVIDRPILAADLLIIGNFHIILSETMGAGPGKAAHAYKTKPGPFWMLGEPNRLNGAGNEKVAP